MRRTSAWIGLGALAMVFWSAVAARVAPAHVAVNAVVIVVVFTALKREPIPVAITALVLGYIEGRQAGAPTGACETALVFCAVASYMFSGQFAGSGAAFFSFVTGIATMGYQLTLFVLLYAGRGTAGFPSWATAALLPSGLATALVALLSYHAMAWLDGKLTTERRQDLGWS
jgi:hypothetical protein